MLMFSIGFPNLSLAHDPCPIGVTLTNLGSPDELDNDTILAGLTTQQKWVGIQYNSKNEHILIEHVFLNSPAYKAGLLKNDIIKSIDRTPVTTIAEVQNIFSDAKLGQQIELSIERDSQSLTIPVTFERRDPVILKMAVTLAKERCRSVRITPVKQEYRSYLLPFITDETGNFRCSDAHILLREIDEKEAINDVFFLRNETYIILTMPYWNTHCVEAASLDGDNLTEDAAIKTLYRAIGDYIDYKDLH